MPKHLERDLGLYSTITVSIGAMIGSGLFVLPGLAAAKAGPSVILAYFLAGLIVMPAALSKAEMATAMPESGGTYLYIDRAMGPLMGTISGLGAWFSLVFKSAFALVGLGAYLVVVLPLPDTQLKLVSLGLAILIVGVNVFGVKQSGQLQAFLVSFVLLILFVFGAEGVVQVRPEQFRPFFSEGAGGLLAATGFVFVSYAGVTKIASIAEEIENPDRNLPIGILLSVAVMIPVYVVVVFVIVGVTPSDVLQSSLTPMADATDQLIGTPGTIAISIVAVLALTSMANAGVLSSSRFPLAMSRDQLAPDALSAISERFQTPLRSIVMTGILLGGLIAFVPVVELAKLASAFKILIFGITNAALIAFRESGVESYDPAFKSPGYPWVQLGGVFGGLVLLTQMGWVPIIGAIGIISGGVVWYRVYGRKRAEREGIAVAAFRESMRAPLISRMRETFSTERGDVMVAVADDVPSKDVEATLLAATPIAAHWGGRVLAARFETVPQQVSLDQAQERVTQADRDFEARIRDLEATDGVPTEAHEIVCHDAGRAALHFAKTHDVELLLGPITPGRWRHSILDTHMGWFMHRASCDVSFLAPRERDGAPPFPQEIVVFLPRAPYAPLKALLADALAQRHGATLRFLTAMGIGAPDDRLDTVQAFHDRLAEHCVTTVESQILRTANVTDDLVAAAGNADLAVVGALRRSRVRALLVSDRTTELLRRLPCSVLLVRPQAPRQNQPLRRLAERYLF